MKRIAEKLLCFCGICVNNGTKQVQRTVCVPLKPADAESAVIVRVNGVVVALVLADYFRRGGNNVVKGN